MVITWMCTPLQMLGPRGWSLEKTKPMEPIRSEKHCTYNWKKNVKNDQYVWSARRAAHGCIFFRWQAADRLYQHGLPGFDTSGSLAKVQARVSTLGKSSPIRIQAGSTSSLVVSPLVIGEPIFCCANHCMLNIGNRRNHHFVWLLHRKHHLRAFGCPR